MPKVMKAAKGMHRANVMKKAKVVKKASGGTEEGHEEGECHLAL